MKYLRCSISRLTFLVRTLLINRRLSSCAFSVRLGPGERASRGIRSITSKSCAIQKSTCPFQSAFLTLNCFRTPGSPEKPGVPCSSSQPLPPVVAPLPRYRSTLLYASEMDQINSTKRPPQLATILDAPRDEEQRYLVAEMIRHPGHRLCSR